MILLYSEQGVGQRHRVYLKFTNQTWTFGNWTEHETHKELRGDKKKKRACVHKDRDRFSIFV